MELKVTLKDPKKSDYFYEEAIKTLRTNIQFSSKQVKVVLLTSCYPNEGKSDIAFSLSLEMGKAGKRVLLMDADIRKSNFIKRYSVNQTIQGLSQYLSGQVERQWIIYQTNFPNVDMIFAGPLAPNPSELLSDPAFGELLEEKRKEYDYIFIDTPPIGNMIDAAIVAEKSDGAVMVIESEAVSYSVAQKSLSQLERSGCKILGAVLNKVDMKKDKYYSSYYGRYGDYYKHK
ncbi:MAG TPA: CpsD/CapB family tyrosine-protein kinase [Candidatus Blautia pullistercoris]|uniref:non-specific protein-tyrosine kinase n=1 Tax=Candidatus Blautia pullistercoris TaxID=2838499 RepID=A0A9D1VNF5_9FIRM|nr:CpsD/CapB family tyrosine-protein kinase [Candidatus Blautia pullistercoris]